MLRRWKSKQKCRLPSFFWTNTTALPHALWLGQIAPESNISCRCAQTASTNGWGIHLNHSLNGASSVTLIKCLVKCVQPSSQDSKEKMSWYSARSEQAELASSGSQDPRLLKSSWTAFLDFAQWSSLESGCLRPHPKPPSCQATFAPQACNWQLPLLLLESSS